MKSFIYLSLIFFTPFLLSGQTIVEHQGIIATNVDVSNNTTIGQITINPTVAGKAIVHFDGSCISSPGDRIILAASNTESWLPNDGNVGVEAVDGDINQNSFSHTRVYDVNAGSNTFYALAQNYVETDGTGSASIYGSLTVEFVPNSSSTIVAHQGITVTNVNVSNNTTVGQITVNPAVAGKAIVHFDGSCISSPGDRIILAASNTESWLPNDGNVGVEAVDGDINQNSFSHTRVYDVNAGSNTFYALAQNYVETDGTGSASIYGSLTVEFVPNEISSTSNFEGNEQIVFYPNPTNGIINISKPLEYTSKKYQLRILDSNGRILQTIKAVNIESRLTDLSKYPDGVYYFQLIDDNNSILKEDKIMKMN